MRSLFSVFAAFAWLALACQCAPANRAHKGMILHTKRPLGPDGKPLPLAPRSKTAGPAQKDSIGQCGDKPKTVDVQQIRNETKDLEKGTPTTLDQMPAGTYDLVGYSANYSVESSQVNYESGMKYSVSPTQVGSNVLDSHTSCVADEVGGQLKPPANLDPGIDFLIDTQFTLTKTSGISVNEKPAALHCAIGVGTSPQATLLNANDPKIIPGTLPIIAALVKNTPVNGEYQNFFPTSQPSTAVITQSPQQANLYQVELIVPEGSPNLPTTRRIFLTYQLEEGGATPPAQDASPATSAGQPQPSSAAPASGQQPAAR